MQPDSDTATASILYGAKTIPGDASVNWHDRGATGKGVAIGIQALGTNADNTMYLIAEHDHHPGERDIAFDSGKALTRAAKQQMQGDLHDIYYR